MLTLFLILLASIFFSCNPTVSLQLFKQSEPLSYSQEVFVFKTDEKLPEDKELLGRIEISDSGFTKKCSYSEIINRAKIEALNAGGNAIKIDSLIRPDFSSACFRIHAYILKIENLTNQ